ncbi:hypothetical protein ACQSMD_17355 [Streptomyces flavovirens]|uniref:hypothetical protein n=1 Tax=Streptomyces flavovirens TaxID=52258 RepID=UPI003D0A1E88
MRNGILQRVGLLILRVRAGPRSHGHQVGGTATGTLCMVPTRHRERNGSGGVAPAP